MGVGNDIPCWKLREGIKAQSNWREKEQKLEMGKLRELSGESKFFILGCVCVEQGHCKVTLELYLW